MARWWCVASTEPHSLHRIVAATLIGLLIAAAADSALAERSAMGQGAWLAGMLLAGLAFWRAWRPPSTRDEPDRAGPDEGQSLVAGAVAARGRSRQIGIDGAAGLHLADSPGAAFEPVLPAGLGAWRIGPWQFVRCGRAGGQMQVLAFDRRGLDVEAWAALQRGLVKARRRAARRPVQASCDSTATVDPPTAPPGSLPRDRGGR